MIDWCLLSTSTVHEHAFFLQTSKSTKIGIKNVHVLHMLQGAENILYLLFLCYVLSSLYIATRYNIPLKTWNMISFYSHDIVTRCTWCNCTMYFRKFVIDIRENNVFLGSKYLYYGFIHQWNWTQRYSWNIVENCVIPELFIQNISVNSNLWRLYISIIFFFTKWSTFYYYICLTMQKKVKYGQ